MDVTPLVRQGQQIIQSYKAGSFKVSGLVYNGPILVFPEKTVAWAAPADFDALRVEHFATLPSAHPPEVILLGTGKTMRLLRPDLKTTLKDRKLTVEAMPTSAACRTYNVLMAEGRRIAAALLPDF